MHAANQRLGDVVRMGRQHVLVGSKARLELALGLFRNVSARRGVDNGLQLGADQQS